MDNKYEYMNNPALWCSDIADAIREKTGETGLIDAVDFPEKIQEIEGTIDYVNDEIRELTDGAYYNMTNLKTFTTSRNIRYIGSYAFYGCSNLESFKFGDSPINTIPLCDNNGVYQTYIPMNAFSRCEKLDNIVVSEGITKLDYNCFSSCINLKTITLPNTLTELGGCVFYNCASLVGITLPDSLVLGYQDFVWCKSLKTLIIPSANTIIPSQLCLLCQSLESVNIPSTITKIEHEAFCSCDNLKDIYYKGTIEQWNAITFGSSWDYNTPNYTIHCTDGDITKS